jgi:hypothetical protein
MAEDYQPLINALKLDLFLAIGAQRGIKKVEECDRQLWVMLRTDPAIQEALNGNSQERRTP